MTRADAEDLDSDDTDDGVATAQSFYSRWAWFYDRLARRTPGIRSLRATAVARLAPARGDVVVEMGCGTGANFPALRDAVGPEGTVVGIDFSPGMLAQAQARIDRADWTNVHVVRGDAARPPVERADALLASFVVGMLTAPDAVVESWLSLVRPGGRAALFDLARATDAPSRLANPLFHLFVLASAPPGTRRRHADSPTRVLDRRVAAAHRTLLDTCIETSHSTHALGFVRLSTGTTPTDRVGRDAP